MKGLGIKGVGLQTAPLSGANLGTPPWDFDPVLVSFTPSMAKRATSVFAASPIIQGKRNTSSTDIGDLVRINTGNAIVGNFYQNFDWNQGTIVYRVTPEYTSPDGCIHWNIFTSNLQFDYNTGAFRFQYKDGSGTWREIGFAIALVAGTTYNIVVRWDSKNTLDGTNYMCISINDTHIFGQTSMGGCATFSSTLDIGSSSQMYSANAIIEGLTIYRRVLYDGTYGVNVGNGDEVNLISAGVDPTTVTGSWDVVFCLPTNASPGALVTGVGEAWSHPHSSNLLTRGFLSDRYYGGGQWGVLFDGTNTLIDCGSGATLDDIPSGGAIMQVELWYRRHVVDGNVRSIITKGDLIGGPGWALYVANSGADLLASCTWAGGMRTLYISNTGIDCKWHHILLTIDDTAKTLRAAVDGIWGVDSGAGVGAYISDAAYNLYLGQNGSANHYHLLGSLGWVRIHNHAHYTPGTNFLPPRAFPGVDANTVEAWALNEGTGATATASVTAPGNNGTITNGTWEPQWYDEGTPVRLRSVVGSVNYAVNVGSDAAIDDLADGAFTVDGWVRFTTDPNGQYLCHKGTPYASGWSIFSYPTSGRLRARIECATTSADSYSNQTVADKLWHYVKMTFDDAGDRKVHLYIDNVEVTYSIQNAGVGAIVSDAAANGYISTNTGYSILSSSAHGWIRWSNVVRGAGMIPRSNPPAVDANTVGQWNCTEGAGSTLDNAEGTATRDGVMSGTYSWQNSPAMESDSPGARNYAWGYVFGSDAADEGFKQTWSGLTVGKDYVIRGLAYSEDGVGQPEIIVYDETNAAILKTMTGTLTSTEKVPDILMCSFELPTVARGAAADCTSISVKIINTSATGVVGFQQVELLANLLDNPSMDTGAVADPWIPYGWTNDLLDAGDSEKETVIQRSGGSSFQINSGAGSGNQSIHASPTIAVGKFFCYGGFGYGNRTFSHYSPAVRASYQSALAQSINLTSNAVAWIHRTCVARAVGGIQILEYGNGVDPSYVDDDYAILLDDVSLTVTPASQANSAESGGIRVDGLDNASQPIPANRLFSTFGWSRFRCMPRHAGADVAKFGNATPVVAYWRGDANNYIYIDWSAASTLRLTFNANGGGDQTGTWATAGAIVAGTNYLMEILYTPIGMQLIVDGTVRITIVASTGFATVPATFRTGNDNANADQYDAVYLAP